MEERMCACGKKIKAGTKCATCWKRDNNLRSFQVWVSNEELDALNSFCKSSKMSKRSLMQKVLFLVGGK